jgi:alkaline phosphatase D
MRAVTGQVSRREVLLGTAALGAVSVLGTPGCVEATPQNPLAAADGRRLYTLGVASGEPLPGSVVIWTRLAPDPLGGGGMPPEPVRVRWEVAADEAMRKVVKRGTATARPEFAHSLHVEVMGLEPHRWYWYRFDAGGEASPVGRTRTAPSAGAGLDRFRLAFTSCQNYQHGYFTAYRHLAAEDLDLVVHLGDYIYEGRVRRNKVRRHNSGDCETLADYRNRYALYKLDPDLQAAHAAFPWYAVSDDHEVRNDYANDRDSDPGMDRAAFLRLRAAAYRAYYEHMPFRAAQRPVGPTMRLYRAGTMGDLIDLNLLDTRQYRTHQPCAVKWDERCAGTMDAGATMLGAAQEAWLGARLHRGAARWTVLAQQVPMMRRMRMSRGAALYNMDKWDGYVAARARLLAAVRALRPDGLIVLSGDVHAAWAGTLRQDFGDPASPALGTEFVGTSIASGGDGRAMRPRARRILAANPDIVFHDGRRGYTRCEVTRQTWRSDYRVLDYVTRPGAPMETAASFTIAHGHPGAEPT